MTVELLWAEEHYRHGEQLLECAKVASEACDYVKADDFRKQAIAHYTAALSACAIWPAVRPCDTCDTHAAEVAVWRAGYQAAEKHFELITPVGGGDSPSSVYAAGAAAYRSQLQKVLADAGVEA